MDYDSDVIDVPLSVGQRTFLFNALSVFLQDNGPLCGAENVALGRVILDKLKITVPGLLDELNT